MSTVIPAAPGFWFLEVIRIAGETWVDRTPIVAWRIEDDSAVAKPITTAEVDPEHHTHICATALESPGGFVSDWEESGVIYSTVAEFETAWKKLNQRKADDAA